MSRLVCLCLVLIGFVVSPVAAQSSAVPERSRVRVRLTGRSGWIVGTLARSSPDSLYLMTAHGRMVVPQSRVTRMDVSWGRHPNTIGGLKDGALIGAGVGALAGIIEMATPNDNSNNIFGADEGTTVTADIIATGILGTFVGIGIGALTPTDRWERAGAGPPQVGLLLLPGPERTRIGLSVRF